MGYPGRLVARSVTQILLASTLLAYCLACSAADAAALRARYQQLQPALHKNVFDAPVYIESQDAEGRMRGQVYGVLEHNFDAVRAALATPAGWCELIPLHLNIKVCVYQATGAGESVLSVFTGSKSYTPIADAKRNDYTLRVQASNASYLHLQVVSESGPLDTSDYRLQMEAIPLDGGRTFALVSFSYRYGAMTRLLSAAYFGTVARSKIGFSIVGQDERGEPIYLRGRAAALERNVMRLYLALQTLLESRARPEPERFEWSIRRWHALTERYPRQLNEIEQNEYLDIKRRERAEPPPRQQELWPTPS